MRLPQPAPLFSIINATAITTTIPHIPFHNTQCTKQMLGTHVLQPGQGTQMYTRVLEMRCLSERVQTMAGRPFHLQVLAFLSRWSSRNHYNTHSYSLDPFSSRVYVQYVENLIGLPVVYVHA
jgi:hypothetical protein